MTKKLKPILYLCVSLAFSGQVFAAGGLPHFVIASGDSTKSSQDAQLETQGQAKILCQSSVEQVTDYQLDEGPSWEKMCGHRWDPEPCGPYHYYARATFACIRDSDNR